MEKVLSLSDFKADASRLLKEVHENPQSLVLTQNGRATAVVQGYEQFQMQQDALLMLKLMVQGEADIQNNGLTPQDVVFSSLRKQFKTNEEGKDAG
ncbi:MAG: type II toxin-antitoxin system Phd/YefM family antitoxin [Gammaproteobacteria bacterium]